MIRKAVVLLLILAAGICAYRGSAPYIDARMEQEHLKQAAFPGNEENRSDNESKVKKPVREETVPYTSPIDFEALKSINPDIVGWIQIPGTVIDYPVCWRANDNEYYMEHSAEGERRAFGAIMLDGANSSAAEEHLVVLYGHHMRNGTMFKDIVRYTDADFLNDHKSLSLFFPDRQERYSVIGTIVCSAKNFEPSQMVEEELLFKEWCRNSWKGLPEEEIQKKMLALVTCSYGSRDERTICFAVAEN